MLDRIDAPVPRSARAPGSCRSLGPLRASCVRRFVACAPVPRPLPQSPGDDPGPATTADLGPVALPANLIVFGRITKPSASLSIAHAWSKLPTPQSEQLSELVVGEPVGPLIDVDQPVDLPSP